MNPAKLLYCIPVFLMLLACNSRNSVTKGGAGAIEMPNTYDSFRDAQHPYYLADLPTRTTARLILEDSIRFSDNVITQRCMDSILSASKETRDYFFPVFLKILSGADGGVADIISYYTMSYTLMFPQEYVGRINNGKLTKWEWEENAAWGLAGEVYSKRLSSENEFYNKAISNFTECDSLTLVQLKESAKRIVGLSRQELKESRD